MKAVLLQGGRARAVYRAWPCHAYGNPQARWEKIQNAVNAVGIYISPFLSHLSLLINGWQRQGALLLDEQSRQTVFHLLVSGPPAGR